jgi:NADH dehydrogenase/NADH:ubiquinone oxidoreductase subunit G
VYCTRCVRFGTEIAGVDFLGALNRGCSTEIGGYVKEIFHSEISGNMNLCPVGDLHLESINSQGWLKGCIVRKRGT